MPAETAVPAEIPLQAPAEAPVEERTEIPAEAVEGTVGAPVVEPTVDPIGEIPAEAVATVSEPSAATDSEGAPVVAEAPAVVAEPLSLFELDPVDVKRAKHRVVLSLYGDTDSVTPAPGKVEPAAEERPGSASAGRSGRFALVGGCSAGGACGDFRSGRGVGHRAVAAGNGAAVLGETLNSDVKTVSDLIGRNDPSGGRRAGACGRPAAGVVQQRPFPAGPRPLRAAIWMPAGVRSTGSTRFRRSGRVHDLHRREFRLEPQLRRREAAGRSDRTKTGLNACRNSTSSPRRSAISTISRCVPSVYCAKWT